MTAVTPDWMRRPEAGLCPCCTIGRRRGRSFVERTIGGAADVLRRSVFADEMSSQPGVLQRTGARVKLAAALVLLVAGAVAHHVTTVAVLSIVLLAAAAMSRLPLRVVVLRVWLFVPLFTGLVVLPATLDVVTPGPVVVPLGTWFGHPLGITSTGLTAAALLVTRVAASVSVVVLLTLTTPWPRLLSALRSLRVPRMFVLVAGMAYRYVFHLLGAVTDMYTARRARTVRRDVDAASGRAFVAASAGALFAKTHALADEVHMAMISRGYRGDARALSETRPGARDFSVLMVAVALAAALVVFDRVVGW